MIKTALGAFLNCVWILRVAKVQLEDDISVSITLPASQVENLPKMTNESIKIIQNCEYRLFRPDDCVIRGFDKQAEADLSATNTFVSNFEPYKKDFAKELIEDSVNFDMYTQPVKDLILDFYENASDDEYFIVPSHPRIVNGEQSKNVRYLQTRPDFVNPIESYLADLSTRLYRKVPLGKSIVYPVNSVLSGRHMSPDKENGFRPLCVYNPIHFQIT